MKIRKGDKSQSPNKNSKIGGSLNSISGGAMNKNTINNNQSHQVSLSTLGSNKARMFTGNSNEIYYTKADGPLDFSFREIVTMIDLKNAIPRKGVKKQVVIESDKQDHKNSAMKVEAEEKVMETKKKKKNEIVQEIIVEGKVFGGGSSDNYKMKKRADANAQGMSDKQENKNTKVIKFLPYTNSVILHSNSIKSLEKIDVVLNEILPDVDFLEEKNMKVIYTSGISPQINITKLDLVQWIDLSHNKLEKIHPDIANLRYLKILYLHANFIQNLSEVTILSRSRALINLTLHGNPIEHIKGYRLLVIEMISGLEKLDFTLISEKELDIIHFKGARFGEVREKKSGKVIIFPAIDQEIIKRMNIPSLEEKKDI